MDSDLSTKEMLGALLITGLVIGIGKLLASNEKFSWRLAVGRALISGGLAVAAGSILAFIPGVGQLAIIGLAAASAVLGEQFLEKLIHAKAGSGS